MSPVAPLYCNCCFEAASESPQINTLKIKGAIMSKQKTPMTPAAAARIQSATAKQTGGQIPKGSFPAKAQKAAAKNVNGGK